MRGLLVEPIVVWLHDASVFELSRQKYVSLPSDGGASRATYHYAELIQYKAIILVDQVRDTIVRCEGRHGGAYGLKLVRTCCG